MTLWYAVYRSNRIDELYPILSTYFDYIFLFGDLNYRLSGKKTEIEDLIKKKGEQDLFSTTPKRSVIQIVI